MASRRLLFLLPLASLLIGKTSLADPPAPPEKAKVEPAPSPADKSDLPEPKPPWRRFHAQGGAFALVGVGILPRVALGPAAYVGLRYQYVALLAEGRFLMTPDYLTPSGTTNAHLYLGFVKGCVNNLPVARFVEVCMGLGSGGLIMGYPGYDDRTLGMEAVHPYTVIANFSAGAEYDLNKVMHLKGFAELGVPIVTTRVSYDSGANWMNVPDYHGIFGIGISFYSKYDAPPEEVLNVTK